MITLVRQDDGAEGYRCGTGVAPLSRIAGEVRALPPEFLPTDAGFPTPAFARYLSPLVGEIPRAERLVW